MALFSLCLSPALPSTRAICAPFPSGACLSAPNNNESSYSVINLVKKNRAAAAAASPAAPRAPRRGPPSPRDPPAVAPRPPRGPPRSARPARPPLPTGRSCRPLQQQQRCHRRHCRLRRLLRQPPSRGGWQQEEGLLHYADAPPPPMTPPAEPPLLWPSPGPEPPPRPPPRPCCRPQPCLAAGRAKVAAAAQRLQIPHLMLVGGERGRERASGQGKDT